MSYLYISVGAIAGAILRYQVDLYFKQVAETVFPLSTLLINVTGSFLIGLLVNLLPADSDLRLLLMVGFCGAFTTFSSYSLEIVRLMQTGHVSAALAYLGLSALLAPLACFLGYMLSR